MLETAFDNLEFHRQPSVPFLIGEEPDMQSLRKVSLNPCFVQEVTTKMKCLDKYSNRWFSLYLIMYEYVLFVISTTQ